VDQLLGLIRTEGIRRTVPRDLRASLGYVSILIAITTAFVRLLLFSCATCGLARQHRQGQRERLLEAAPQLRAIVAKVTRARLLAITNDTLDCDPTVAIDGPKTP